VFTDEIRVVLSHGSIGFGAGALEYLFFESQIAFIKVGKSFWQYK
jgi:hypothetical protein